MGEPQLLKLRYDEAPISDAGLREADHGHTRAAAKLVLFVVGKNTIIFIVPSSPSSFPIVANWFSINAARMER